MRELTIYGAGFAITVREDSLKGLWIEDSHGELIGVTPELDVLHLALQDSKVMFELSTITKENEGTVDEKDTHLNVKYSLKQESIYYSIMVEEHE